MVTANDKAKSGDKPAAKRTVLSPAEKIAKLEAELKAAREKAHDKDRKVVEHAKAELKKVEDKIKVLADKRDALNKEIEEASGRIAGPVTDGVGEPDA